LKRANYCQHGAYFIAGFSVALYSDKVDMKWEFVGIGDIIPIYEDIEDKAELLWSDYGFISARRSERFVKTKKELLKNIKLKRK
jgi:hypothetical protein